MQIIQTQFELEEGDDLVFIAMAGALPVPVYQVTATIQKQSAAVKKLIYGTCSIVSSITDGREYEAALKHPSSLFDPAWFALRALDPLAEGPHTADTRRVLDDLADSFEVKRLNTPKHSALIGEHSDKKYVQEKNYVGKDRVDFLVTGKD